MLLKFSLCLIVVMCFHGIASDQLTFSSDTIEFGLNPGVVESDTLRIMNETDEFITIDSIIFTWNIKGEAQADEIGIGFEIENPQGVEWFNWHKMYMVPDIITLNDSTFCFTLREEEENIEFNPNKELVLIKFMFGRCIGCAGIMETNTNDMPTTITTIFVNSESGRDTVIFIGMRSDLIQSGVIEHQISALKTSEKSMPEDGVFLVSGRKAAPFRKINATKRLPINMYYTKSAKALMPLRAYPK